MLVGQRYSTQLNNFEEPVTFICFRGPTRGTPAKYFPMCDLARIRIRAQSERVWNEVARLRIGDSGLESPLRNQPAGSMLPNPKKKKFI